MAVTPEENVAYLQKIRAEAAKGAKAAAEAAAAYIADRVANDTLTRTRNNPGQYHVARPGAPPAYGTGTLARSVYSTKASGGLRATALAGSDDKRARMFELGGCVLKAGSGKMKWRDSGRKDNPSGWWAHWLLNADGKHEFLGPTTEDALDDGELRRVIIKKFREYDP